MNNIRHLKLLKYLRILILKMKMMLDFHHYIQEHNLQIYYLTNSILEQIIKLMKIKILKKLLNKQKNKKRMHFL